MMKKSAAILFALVAIFCVGLSSCGKSGSDSDSSNGSGVADGATVVGYWGSPDGNLLKFNEDGTMQVISSWTKSHVDKETGEEVMYRRIRFFDTKKYSVDNDKITITKNGNSKTGDIVKLTNDELTVKADGQTQSFKRISEDEYKAKTQDVLSERPADF